MSHVRDIFRKLRFRTRDVIRPAPQYVIILPAAEE